MTRPTWFTPRTFTIALAVVAVEGLLIWGVVLAGAAAPRPCTDATGQVDELAGGAVERAWSVPVRLQNGGDTIGVLLTGEPDLHYLWSDGSAIVAFGEASAARFVVPEAGSAASPITHDAGEIIFDTQRPVQACFET